VKGPTIGVESSEARVWIRRAASKRTPSLRFSKIYAIPEHKNEHIYT